MTTGLHECEQKAKRLPAAERAQLIEHLIGTLDDLDETECERLWLEEAERRYKEFKRGNVPARPAAAVFRDARNRLAAIK